MAHSHGGFFFVRQDQPVGRARETDVECVCMGIVYIYIYGGDRLAIRDARDDLWRIFGVVSMIDGTRILMMCGSG